MNIEMENNLFNRVNKYKTSEMFKPFYRGTSKNKLMVQRCTQTDKYIWPPRIRSPHSPFGEVEWGEIEGNGSVYTYNVVYRSFHPYFSDKVPYVIGIIELDAGIRMLGNVLIDPEKVSIGMKVRAEFVEVSDDLKLVQWKAV